MHPSCLHGSFQVVWFPLKTCMLNIQSLTVQFSLISKKALQCLKCSIKVPVIVIYKSETFFHIHPYDLTKKRKRKHELSRSTNVWASFHRTLTSETAPIKHISYRCALSSGSKSRDTMQNQRLQSNYESASFFLPLSTFRIEIMFFFKAELDLIPSVSILVPHQNTVLKNISGFFLIYFFTAKYNRPFCPGGDRSGELLFFLNHQYPLSSEIAVEVFAE